MHRTLLRSLSILALVLGLLLAPVAAQAAPTAGHASPGWSPIAWLQLAWSVVWGHDDAGPGLDPSKPAPDHATAPRSAGPHPAAVTRTAA